MLLSCLIFLQPTETTSIPSNLGRAAHAWFLDQVRRIDAPLAAELHADQTQQRPFTVSNLLGIGWRPEQVALSPDRRYALRVTSFSPQLSALLRQRVLPNLPETVHLGPATLRIVDHTTDPTVHPWAGEETFGRLVQRHTLAADMPRRVALRFASPTFFRSADRNQLVPLPGLVFGSLLDRWNAYAPLQLHPDVRRFAEECLVISRYRLETVAVRLGSEGEHGAAAGCVGTCTYAVQVRDRYWLGLIHLLAAFAMYGGVGKWTTMGLGQVRGDEQRDKGAEEQGERGARGKG